MDRKKRALLIASPSFGLRGPLNDVRLMSDILSDYGFEITPCYDQDATRKGILEAWRKIIAECQPDDTLVIYYSGHGGIVEDPSLKQPNDNEAGVKRNPWRFQFLVPMDYRPNDDSNDGNGENEAAKESDHEFTGILDVEVKQLRAEASRRTRNVTIILDCCHSGSMSRHPTREAIPRGLPNTQQYNALSRHFNLLRDNSQYFETEGSEQVVTIVAADATETAWEYSKAPDQWVGSMTQAFTDALTDAQKSYKDGGESVSWRTILVRVRELVNVQFPQQHPHVEGPDKRLLFSLEESSLNAISLRVEEGTGFSVLLAGRLSGVRKGNVYGLWPLEAEQRNDATRLGTATVTYVESSKALTRLYLLPEKKLEAKYGAIAFLEKEALQEWPIACPGHLEDLRCLIDASPHLCDAVNQQGSPLAEVRHEGQTLTLNDNQGFQIASRDVSANDPDSLASASQYIVSQAETLARAQHLLTLTCDNPNEKLDHQLRVTIGTAKNGEKERVVELDGSGYVTEGERLYISLENEGTDQLYAFVFNINVYGKRRMVSSHRPRGIGLPRNGSSLLGEGSFGSVDGLPITWPDKIPRTGPVNECLVIIVTDSHLDLGCLDDSHSADGRGSASGSTTLEQVAFSLATGSPRDVGSASRSSKLSWNLMQINFAIRPSAWQGEDGREIRPEDIPEPNNLFLEDVTLSPPFWAQPEAKSIYGRVKRSLKRIPNYVWVVNQHDEEIRVVVSKYRPRRLLTDIGVDVSATGGGLNFASTTFYEPICQKILAPSKDGGNNGDNMGVFPLWTSKEGFGVVSIFKGPQKDSYIENDRIPIGATAYFCNKPNLEIFDYHGKAISNGPRGLHLSD